jgi:hypothetical protein
VQKFDVERFNLKKLSALDIKKQYQLKISNGFAALENINVSKNINRAWENITENKKFSTKESLGLHEPWFVEERSQFLEKRKQAKIQWVQNQNQSNGDKLNNVRHETSRHSRNKK